MWSSPQPILQPSEPYSSIGYADHGGSISRTTLVSPLIVTSIADIARPSPVIRSGPRFQTRRSCVHSTSVMKVVVLAVLLALPGCWHFAEDPPPTEQHTWSAARSPVRADAREPDAEPDVDPDAGRRGTRRSPPRAARPARRPDTPPPTPRSPGPRGAAAPAEARRGSQMPAWPTCRRLAR